MTDHGVRLRVVTVESVEAREEAGGPRPLFVDYQASLPAVKERNGFGYNSRRRVRERRAQRRASVPVGD